MTQPVQQPPTGLLELYKLGADFADKVSARRNTANGFFLTAETALVTVVAFVLGQQRPEDGVKAATVAAGVLLSATWWLQLRSYRDLNKAKFAVLTAMEAGLPVALFTEEQKARSPVSFRSRKKCPCRSRRVKDATVSHALAACEP